MDKFKHRVRYLVESDAVIGCRYCWCVMQGIVVCVWLAICADDNPSRVILTWFALHAFLFFFKKLVSAFFFLVVGGGGGGWVG